MVCATIWLWNTAPSTAIPVAIPTWRNVLLAPEAMPLRCGWTTEMAPEAKTGLTIPIPKPTTRKPGSSTVQVEFAWVVAIEQEPAGDEEHPDTQQEARLHPNRQAPGEEGA